MQRNEYAPPPWMGHIAPGTLDHRVLTTQDRFWVTADAVVLPLASMTREHLTAVIAHLHANHATHLHMAAMVDALLDLIETTATGSATGEQLVHELTGDSIASVDAHVYLESTPLVRAIRRELATRH